MSWDPYYVSQEYYDNIGATNPFIPQNNQSQGGFLSGLKNAFGSVGDFLSGGAGSMISGIANGLFGYLGQRESNKAMLQANRDTNEHNYKIWQEQQQHNVDMFNMENQANIDMWNMQNEYNDPSAQVERLRKAGLNPAMAMGNNASGVASSAPSSASVNPSQAPQMQAPPPDAFTSPALVGLQQGLQSMLSINQILGTNKRLLGMDLDNKTRDLLNKTSSFDLSTKMMLSETNYQQQRMVLQNMIAQNSLINLDIQAKQFMNAVIPTQLQNQLAMDVANISLLQQQGLINDKQLEQMTADISKTYAEIILTQQKTEESKASASNLYASANYYNSLTALNEQTYQFNEDTRELNIANKKQTNLGLFNNNELQRLQIQLQKGIIKPMIKATVSGFDLQHMNNQNGLLIQGDVNSVLNNSSFMRGLAGFGNYMQNFSGFVPSVNLIH